ncbi:prolipoprotein diacylglyceryl transferase [Myxococcota bacterium]
MTPRVPFLHVEDLELLSAGALGQGLPPGPLSIKAFGTLVAVGVYLGAFLALRQGRRSGLPRHVLGAFVLWVFIGGFAGGHVLGTLMYEPERAWRDPCTLLMLWDGQSSFGGFAGAVLAALLFRSRYRMPWLPYAEAVASAFPVGWLFGRCGCALAHDHPGQPSSAWFAVLYPDGGRFDLGLYEMVLTLPLAAVFLVLRRRPQPLGLYLTCLTLTYAPMRLALDFLRARHTSGPQVPVVDARYGPLTPAQWGCLGLLGAGCWLFGRLARTIDGPEWQRIRGTRALLRPLGPEAAIGPTRTDVPP